MISHIFEQKKIVYSIEVFPPKKADDIHLVYQAIDEMKQCCPDFISVTYGAGGGTSKETLAIASYIKNQCHIESLAHLTCAALTAEELEGFVGKFKEHSLSNVLALRGDKPKAMDQAIFDQRYYKYASDLVRALQGNDFCIAGACYPEKHPDVATMEEDIDNLKQKVEQGVSFLITQLFFDNQKFYRFLDLCERNNIQIPVAAGIMPITTERQVNTMIDIADASVPADLYRSIEKYRGQPEDLKKAGIEFAIMQKQDLEKHGVRGIHLYAMNKPDIVKQFFGI